MQGRGFTVPPIVSIAQRLMTFRPPFAGFRTRRRSGPGYVPFLSSAGGSKLRYLNKCCWLGLSYFIYLFGFFDSFLDSGWNSNFISALITSQSRFAQPRSVTRTRDTRPEGAHLEAALTWPWMERRFHRCACFNLSSPSVILISVDNGWRSIKKKWKVHPNLLFSVSSCWSARCIIAVTAARYWSWIYCAKYQKGV